MVKNLRTKQLPSLPFTLRFNTRMVSNHIAFWSKLETGPRNRAWIEMKATRLHLLSSVLEGAAMLSRMFRESISIYLFILTLKSLSEHYIRGTWYKDGYNWTKWQPTRSSHLTASSARNCSYAACHSPLVRKHTAQRSRATMTSKTKETNQGRSLFASLSRERCTGDVRQAFSRVYLYGFVLRPRREYLARQGWRANHPPQRLFFYQ